MGRDSLDWRKTSREYFNQLKRCRGYFAVIVTDPDTCVASKQVAKEALKELAHFNIK